MTVKIRRHLPAAAKIRVELPIGAVANDCETQRRGAVARIAAGLTRNNELSIGLQNSANGYIIATVEVSCYLAASAEGFVEAPIGIVTRHREVVVIGVVIGTPRNDDFAIDLQGHTGTAGVVFDLCDHLAALSKSR